MYQRSEFNCLRSASYLYTQRPNHVYLQLFVANLFGWSWIRKCIQQCVDVLFHFFGERVSHRLMPKNNATAERQREYKWKLRNIHTCIADWPIDSIHAFHRNNSNFQLKMYFTLLCTWEILFYLKFDWYNIHIALIFLYLSAIFLFSKYSLVAPTAIMTNSGESSRNDRQTISKSVSGG